MSSVLERWYSWAKEDRPRQPRGSDTDASTHAGDGRRRDTRRIKLPSLATWRAWGN